MNIEVLTKEESAAVRNAFIEVIGQIDSRAPMETENVVVRTFLVSTYYENHLHTLHADAAYSALATKLYREPDVASYISGSLAALCVRLTYLGPDIFERLCHSLALGISMANNSIQGPLSKIPVAVSASAQIPLPVLSAIIQANPWLAFVILVLLYLPDTVLADNLRELRKHGRLPPPA